VQPKINKILKTLEERMLVKSVKSVQNASRKVGGVGQGVNRSGGLARGCKVSAWGLDESVDQCITAKAFAAHS